MRTPAQMAEDVNNLNCHAPGAAYGPVTVAQMEAIYKEARKIEWTDKKPDRAGWWWYQWTDEVKEPMKIWQFNGEWRANGFLMDGYSGQWSTRPIDMPEEARKEQSK